jgi:hypothetical protein
MEIEQSKAYELYRVYLEACKREDATDIDQELRKVYYQLSKGKRLLDLPTVMNAIGLDEQNRPYLAIARADAQRVWYRGSTDGSGSFQTLRWISHYRRSTRVVNLPPGTFPLNRSTYAHGTGLSAIVPFIPPDIRPPQKDLKGYYILWEADWKEVPIDPFLLRRVTGNIFIILAQWDLSPIERKVIEIVMGRDGDL